MKFITYLAIFIGGLITCYLLLSLGVVDKFDGMPGTQEEPTLSLPTYLSFLSVMMTAVTAVLASLAIGIGIVAAYTFKELKEEAKTIAERTSKEISEKTSKEVSESTSKEVSSNTASYIAQEALSEVKVKAMVYELYAKAEKERQHVEEWGEAAIEQED